MFYRKFGIPKEGELVVCTVTKIHFNSVFVTVDEYDKRAMLHISEVSPGRIRNLRDYVKEGKVIICVVLRIQQERGLIDVSLRRVNEGQRRKKLSQIKQEQTAEKIVEFIAKERKIEFRKLYDELTDLIFEKYSSLYECFEEVVMEDLSLISLGIKEDLAKQLDEIIKQRIKPPKIFIGGKLFLTSYADDGVNVVKQILEDGQKLHDNIAIKYLGGGSFKLSIVAEDYKSGEKLLDNTIKFLEKECKNKKTIFRFERMEIEN